jgi:putative CocE/NonD family hydrolase
MTKSTAKLISLFSIILLIITACSQRSSIQIPRLVIEHEVTYFVQDSILIDVRDGAKIHAIIVRNSEITKPTAAILFHSIYARKTDLDRAKKAADKGYVGVVSYTRGKGLSPDEVVPYEYEATDVYDVIDWISKQNWSNEEVGMYGGSYVGFVQWASMKHKVHPALKTIVPSVAVAPGIAEPMENGVYQNFHYPWSHYVSSNKYLDTTLYNNGKRWNDLNMKWYETGVAYKSIDSLDGLANEKFNKKLLHPTYDSYWQNMIPYKEEFSHVNIPILNTTGYYDGGQIGSLHYLKEHYKYNKNAEHYLLIGPYTHFGAQSVPGKEIYGYVIDPVAQISVTDIIFDWFDYIFKGAKKPELLKDKINYQIMGSNTWGHSASLEKMANDTLTYYFSKIRSNVKFKSTYDTGNLGVNEHFTLSNKANSSSYLEQVIDFSDRGKYTWNLSGGGNLISNTLTIGEGFSFATEVFQEDVELSGAFQGAFEVAINKKDFDCTVLWYEQTAEGEFFSLSLPFIGRASLANNIEKRQLLTPNKKSTFSFTNVRMTSRKISKGSRIVVVVNGLKHPYAQINYGTGKDVSTETVKNDAKEPLVIKWFSDSFIKIPFKR